MPKTYNVYDTESGRVVSTFKLVADTARLTGGEVTSGSAVLTVASTTNVWPGMRLRGKGIPANTLVLSIDSANTLTMTANATASASGLIVVAHAYIDVAVLREIHIEHYRDLFGGVSPVTIAGEALSAGSLSSPGAITYPSNPTFTVPTGGIQPGLPACIASNSGAEVTLSDNLSHTAPREQVRKETCHYLVCNDGTLLPVPVFPGMHLAQASST